MKENSEWDGWNECYDSEVGKAFFKCFEDNKPFNDCIKAQGQENLAPADDQLSQEGDSVTVVEDGTLPPINNKPEEDRNAVAERLVDRIDLEDFNKDEFDEREWRFLTIFAGRGGKNGDKPFDKSLIAWMTEDEWKVIEDVKDFYDSADGTLAQVTELPSTNHDVAIAEALVDQINLDDFDATKFTEREWRFLTIFAGRGGPNGDRPFDVSNIPWMTQAEWELLDQVYQKYNDGSDANLA